jgi:hypothetical protein
MKIKNSYKFRILVVISIIYILLASTQGYFRLEKFIWHISPIWIFWSSVWIWPKKFENFFGVGEKAEEKKELNKWVYWDAERAKKHKYYGIGGWALLLAIGIGLSIIASVVLEVSLLVVEPGYDALIEKYPDYEQLSIFMDIQYWASVVLASIVLYLLITHKSSFQKYYVAVYIFSLITDTMLLKTTMDILEIKGNDLTYIVLHLAKYYIAGFIWLIYVLKSKRINLTTKKRIKKKYENHTFFKV